MKGPRARERERKATDGANIASNDFSRSPTPLPKLAAAIREHAQVIESCRELPLPPGGIMSMGTARHADRSHD